VSVEKGNLNYQILLDMNSQIFGYKPQSRVLRSEDANQQDENGSLSSCGAERNDVENIDDSIEFLVVGQGPATVRYVKSYALTVPEDKSGDSRACQDEENLSAVRFDGAAVQGSSDIQLDLALSQLPTQDFHSVVTDTVIVGDFSAVGVGVAESIISQRAADRVAKIIATKMAENELIMVLPKTISLGLE
jgi:hypothetical protein